MKITITKQDYKRFYIHNYFNGQTKIIRFMRRYMGPLMIVGGLYLYWQYENQINIILIGLMMAYGAFYTIKPFLFITIFSIQDETFTIRFNENELNIKDRLKEGNIDLTRNKLIENEQYFFVKLDSKQILFFPKFLLDKKMIEEFRSRTKLIS